MPGEEGLECTERGNRGLPLPWPKPGARALPILGGGETKGEKQQSWRPWQQCLLRRPRLRAPRAPSGRRLLVRGTPR